MHIQFRLHFRQARKDDRTPSKAACGSRWQFFPANAVYPLQSDRGYFDDLGSMVLSGQPFLAPPRGYGTLGHAEENGSGLIAYLLNVVGKG